MTPKKKEIQKQPKINPERAYAIIRKPLLTEKSTRVSQDRQYVFKISKDASKPEIKEAIEYIFKVEVDSVNTLIRKGKVKRFKGREGKLSDVKLAYVSLKEGHMIDMGASL